MNKTLTFPQNKRFAVIMTLIVILLFIPLIAMQFTEEVNWSLADFIVAGILLSGTGLLFELVLRKITRTSHRIIICAGILLGLFLIWAELAVGIFGTRFAGS